MDIISETTRRGWLNFVLASAASAYWPSNTGRRKTNKHRPSHSDYFEVDLSSISNVYNPVTRESVTIREGVLELTAWSIDTGKESLFVSVAGGTSTGERGVQAIGDVRGTDYRISSGGVVTQAIEPPYPSKQHGHLMTVVEEVDGTSVWFASLLFSYLVNADGTVTELSPIAISS